MKHRIAITAIQHPEHPELYLHQLRSDSGKWCLPGGHLLPGELPEEGGLRELKEETSLKPKDFKLIDKGIMSHEDGEPVEFYLFHAPAEPFSKLTSRDDPDSEAVTWKYLNPLVAENQEIPADKNILIKYLKKQKKLAKSESDQRYHIHVNGQRITSHPLTIPEIKKQTGKHPKEIEKDPNMKVIPHRGTASLRRYIRKNETPELEKGWKEATAAGLMGVAALASHPAKADYRHVNAYLNSFKNMPGLKVHTQISPGMSQGKISVGKFNVNTKAILGGNSPISEHKLNVSGPNRKTWTPQDSADYDKAQYLYQHLNEKLLNLMRMTGPVQKKESEDFWGKLVKTDWSKKSKIHGWVSPKGEFHPMPIEEDHDQAAERLGFPDMYAGVHQGWIAMGHAGEPNMSVSSKTLKARSSPAMSTARNMMGENHPGQSMSLYEFVDPTNEEDAIIRDSVPVDHFARHGVVPKRIIKSELRKSPVISSDYTTNPGINPTVGFPHSHHVKTIKTKEGHTVHKYIMNHPDMKKVTTYAITEGNHPKGKPLSVLEVAEEDPESGEKIRHVGYSHTRKEHRGKGLGSALYRIAVKDAKLLHSDRRLTPDSHHQWEKLSQNPGIKVKLAPRQELYGNNIETRHKATYKPKSKLNKAMPPSYIEQASNGAALMIPVTLGDFGNLHPGIPHHISIKVFDPKRDDMKSIIGRLNAFKNLPRPNREQLTFEPHTLTSAKTGTQYKVLKVHGLPKEYYQVYDHFKNSGFTYPEFAPHITLDPKNYDRIVSGECPIAKMPIKIHNPTFNIGPKPVLSWENNDLKPDLKKAEDAPNKSGQTSANGRYESVFHEGEHAWKNNKSIADRHDKNIARNKRFFTEIQKPEHQKIVGSFFDFIANHPNRHLIPSWEKGQPMPRARHLDNLFNGSETGGRRTGLEVKEINNKPIVVFKAFRHGEEPGLEIPENHELLDTWVYHPNIGIKHQSRRAVPKNYPLTISGTGS